MASVSYSEQQARINDDKVPQTLGANIACLVVAFVGILLRLLSRRIAGARIGIDDWLAILAVVLYTAAAIDGFICIAFGAGRHEAAVQEHKEGFAKASFAFIILYRPAIAFVKFSVLFLYRRIFPQARFRTVLTYYGIFVALYTIAFLILDIFHCRPVHEAWSSGGKTSCLNMDTIWIVGGSLNAITDLAALCLPMPLLWKLHVTKEKRIQLMGIFLLGGFVCIVSIIRVIELSGLQTSSDESYVYSTTIIWSTVEVGVGIFCACLPVMRPILHALTQYVPKMEAKSSGASSTNFPKQSHATNFRMKSYRRSECVSKLDDQEPFATEEPQILTSVVRNSIGEERDVETGYGDHGISVTTKIEQEVNSRPE